MCLSIFLQWPSSSPFSPHFLNFLTFTKHYKVSFLFTNHSDFFLISLSHTFTYFRLNSPIFLNKTNECLLLQNFTFLQNYNCFHNFNVILLPHIFSSAFSKIVFLPISCNFVHFFPNIS